MDWAKIRRIAVASVGFSLTWVLLQPGSIPRSLVLSGAFYDMWYGILLGSLIGAGILAVCARRRVEPFVEKHRFVVFSLTMLSVAGFVLLTFAESAPFPEALCVVAALLLAVGNLALLLGWFVSIFRLANDEACIVVAASVVAYALLRSACFQLGDALVVLDGFSPMISGVFWLMLASMGKPKDREDQNVSCRRIDCDAAVLRKIPFFLVGPLALCLVCGRVTMGVFFGVVAQPPNDTMLLRNALIALMAVAFLVAVVRLRDKKRILVVAWIPPTALLLFGQIFILAFGSEQLFTSSAAITSALMCIEALALIVLFQFAQERSVSPVLVVGLGYIILRIIPIAIQRSFAMQLVTLFSVPEGSLVLVVITAVMAVITGLLVFFFRFALEAGDSGSPAPEMEAAVVTQPEACRMLGEEAGLSPRETDIIVLVSEGNSQKRVSEKLGISYGTVQWYMKLIYRKLDIHSKQELVDLVEERLSSGGASLAPTRSNNPRA